MRDSSYNSSHQSKQTFSRGGEKKVMKKSLSLLLAIALVFGMFYSVAAAATPTPAEAGQKLQGYGIIQGSNGDLMEDSTWLRQDVAVLLSRLLGVEAEAKAHAKTHTFTDTKGTFYDGYLSWAKEEGYIIGNSPSDFGFGDELTNQQFAAIVLRVFGIDDYDNAVAKGIEFGILSAGAEAAKPAKRGDTFVGIVAALDVEVPGTGKKLGAVLKLAGYEEVAPAVSAKAVGAKKVEVSFNKAVDDTKVTFAVKKSSITLNVSAKSFSADKKTATLELSSKLTTGDYTVSAKEGDATALTASFKAEDEKVAKIEFKSVNAPLVDDAGGDDTLVDDLAIPYQVVNQYGENITKFTTLSTSIGSLNSTAGLVEINGNYRVNDVVTVALVHATTATSAVQTFTVAAEAKVAEVAISGIYNKDNKTINEDTNLINDKFYLVLEAKDQYGNAITNLTKLKNDLIVNETNPSVVRADIAASPAPFETVSINGADKTALRLINPASGPSADIGSTTVTLISNTTGKNASFTVTVGEASRTDVANLVNPGLTVEDEDAYFPAEVFDKNGTAITDLNVLNDTTKGVKITFNGANISNPFVLKDDLIQVKVPGTVGFNDSVGIKSVIAMSSSNKITSLLVDVKEAAVPTVVRGFDSDFNKAVLDAATASFTVDVSNLAIEDQYGRVMSDDNVKTWLNLNANTRIEFTEATAGAPSAIDIAGAGDTAVINAGTDSFTVTVNAGKASEKLTITLGKDAAPALLTASAVDQTIRVTDGTEFVSYSVDSIGTVYDEDGNSRTNNATYNKEIKAFGHLDDGNKVKLPTSYYTVNALSNATVNDDVYNTSVVGLTTANVIGDDVLDLSYGDKSEVVVPVTVTINAKGQQFTQDVTISKAAPKVTAVKFVATADGVEGGAKSEISIGTAAYNISDLVSGAYRVVVTDQYGVKEIAGATGAVTFDEGTAVTAVNFTVTPGNGDITIANNGTANASVSGLAAYEDFYVTVTYPGGVSAKIKVKF